MDELVKNVNDIDTKNEVEKSNYLPPLTKERYEKLFYLVSPFVDRDNLISKNKN